MKTLEHLDWDDLRVFLHVGRTGCLSIAARQLRIDHSTASRRISRLEFSVGAGLFERHRTGLRLNETGQMLLEQVEEMENGVIAIREHMQKGRTEVTGIVRVATLEGIASLYLSPRLDRLRTRLPGIKLELVTSSQVVHVDRREADIFLGFFQPSGKAMAVERIGAFRLGLYASPSYLARKGMPACPAELCRHDFITYIDDLIQLDAVRWLDEVIREPRVAFRSNNMIAQIGAAAAGEGLVLLPVFAAEAYETLVPVLFDRVAVRRDIWLSAHRDSQFTLRIKAMVRFLKAIVAEDQTFLLGEGSQGAAAAARPSAGDAML